MNPLPHMYYLILFSICSTILFAEQDSEKFGFALSEQLLQNQGNVFISPYSAEIALRMALEGANGKTQEEMNAVIGSAPQRKLSDKDVHSFQAMAIDASLKPLESYREAIQQQFQATIFPVDFTKNPKKSLSFTNKSVLKATQGLIKNFIQPQDVSEKTKLILLNAIYFKKQWASPFSVSKTEKAPFTTCDDTKIAVDMMRQQEFFSCGTSDGVSYLELRFKEEENAPEYSCMLILPSEKNALLQIEQSLTAEKLAEWDRSLRKEYVELFFPKVTLDFRIDLKEALKTLGMREAFSESADFSKISPHLELAIDKVLHQTHLTIDEQGLEAAASSAAIFIVKAERRPEHSIVMRFDHPFLIVIREKQSGTLLFIGRICNPL